MMTGLSIAKHLKTVLSSCPEVRSKVGDRIFPISTVTSTSFPFIVYDRGSVSPEYTKDGRCMDTVGCTVYVMTENYMDGVEIAEAVRQVLENTGKSYEDVDVSGAEMSGAVEAFTNDTFVQQLNFTFEID